MQNYQALKFSAPMACFYISTVSVCFHFGTPHLRLSRRVRVSLVELDKYFEKTKGKKKRKENQRANSQAKSCLFYLGVIKIETFQEELRQRELMDLGKELPTSCLTSLK